jgi:hypothetical protein
MSYVIQRFYINEDVRPKSGAKPGRAIARYDTLEEAQAHCQREDTHGGPYCPTHGLLRALSTPLSVFAHCPKCGAATVPAWFDGFTAAGNL